uniref:Uncharacterized protein n=2 Tax=Oryza TaxID=4527 RepID=Q6YXU8_ORYSJ|nr:hypothetical protein [Oryza sativa Japonica Group]BAD13250.1 hypothetical protein [Oryza sativa Japonica Group]
MSSSAGPSAAPSAEYAELDNNSESSTAFLQAIIDSNRSSKGIEPIWFAACTYTLWKSRNNRVFEG